MRVGVTVNDYGWWLQASGVPYGGVKGSMRFVVAMQRSEVK